MTRHGILIVTGRKGSGKTQLVRAFLARCPRSLVIDTQGEYGGVLITDPWSLQTYLVGRGADRPFRISYRDRGEHGVPMTEVFHMLHYVRDYVLCLEEASLWMGPTVKVPEVDWFWQYGRHNRVSLVGVARRPAELARGFSGQADVFISFGMHEPVDLEYLRAVGGPEAADRVAALGPYEWEYVRAAHPEMEGLLEDLSESVPEPAEAPPGGAESSGTPPEALGLPEAPQEAPAAPTPPARRGTPPGRKRKLKHLMDLRGRT